MGNLVKHVEIGRMQVIRDKDGEPRVIINGAAIEAIILKNWGGVDQVVKITIDVDVIQRETDSAASSGYEGR